MRALAPTAHGLWWGLAEAGRTPILGRTVRRRATKRATETQTASHGIPPREMRALAAVPVGKGVPGAATGGGGPACQWAGMKPGTMTLGPGMARVAQHAPFF